MTWIWPLTSAGAVATGCLSYRSLDSILRHRLDTEPLVERATGRGIDVAPFLAHAARVVGG